MARRLRHLLMLLALGAVCALGYTTYALTANNVVPATRSGVGTGTISAYTPASIDYTLNASTPSNIDTVTFTITPTAANSVKAKLNGTWYACTNTAGSVSCGTTSPQAVVLAANTLQVVAAT